ncbi:MAG: hypothetical protein VXX55_04170 [Planctomycetota bacterium]|nr:hypothetical protein [Planctomycetota bacterium]
MTAWSFSHNDAVEDVFMAHGFDPRPRLVYRILPSAMPPLGIGYLEAIKGESTKKGHG